MSNDPKQPQKTIMGWGAQVPGQPQGTPQPQWQQPPAAPQPQWPQQPVAPQPVAPQPSQPQWQQPPAAPQQQWQQPPVAPQPQWQQPAAAPPQQQWQQPQPQQAWTPPGMPQMPQMPQMPSAPPMDVGGGRAIPGANATVGVSARVRFIRLTYLHLFAAILAFTGLEYLLLTNATLVEKVSLPLVKFAFAGRFNWGIVLAVFTGTSIATHWLAQHTHSKPLHYLGLALYVVAEALIFVPLMAIVIVHTQEIVARGGGNPNILRDSALITLGIFGALTATVLFSKKDFSFLRSALIVGGAAAMGLIVLSLVFGFNLGIVFAVAMVLLAAGQILYETSQIVAHANPEEYVGAALSLFSSIALLFWYVLQIVNDLRD